MKEEHLLDIALELSDKLFESEPTHGLMVQGSNMIRKLVAELDKKDERTAELEAKCKSITNIADILIDEARCINISCSINFYGSNFISSLGSSSKNFRP